MAGPEDSQGRVGVAGVASGLSRAVSGGAGARAAGMRLLAGKLEQGHWPGWFVAKVDVGPACGGAAAGGSFDQASLEEIGLVDVLDRVRFLADGDRKRGEA